MSGVFGIIDERQNTRLDQAIIRMGNVMRHRKWYIVETYWDESTRVSLGRIGIGILNREPQPVISEDGNTVLFLAGEFFDWEGAPDRADDLRRDRFRTDAEYALRMYKVYGVDFVRHLAGAFVIAIYDRLQRVVMLVTDRFGLYPLYFEHRDGYLVFAPEIKGIRAVADRLHPLDDVALAQYMRFQQLLGTRTFFKDIQMLAPASVLTFELKEGLLRIDTYWSFDQISALPARITFREAVEESARLMRLAVARRLRGDHRMGVYLSGGLDSRTILAAYPPDSPRPTTITFGLRNCKDVYYAARVARRAGTPHCFCELFDGNWVKEYADFHLDLTEGFHSWVHMHGINTLETARHLFDINLTGFAGDQNLGGFSDASVSLGRSPDELAYLANLFELFVERYHWPGISEAEERLLYTPQTYARLAGLAFESLRQELQPYLKYDRERRIDYFGFIQLDLRHYYHYVTFTRSYIDVRHPYCDYDLVDFLLALPVSFRVARRLQIAVLNRLNPSLAMVPVDKDDSLPIEQPVIRDIHRSLQLFKRRFNKYVYPLFPEQFTLHSDYERWLRHELRDWAEAILFDSRTAGRSIWNPDFIRSLWTQHLSGQRPWMLGKIAPVMTYEMMLRKLYDAQWEQCSPVFLGTAQRGLNEFLH